MMESLSIKGKQLIGISLLKKTSNDNGQAQHDIAGLWKRFEVEGVYDKIPGKVEEAVYAVYHKFDGDHTKPYSYFIGVPVKHGTEPPIGLDSVVIPAGNYRKFTARGKMPQCIGDTWVSIWQAPISRAYLVDFEVYDDRSHYWDDVEVDIFIS